MAIERYANSAATTLGGSINNSVTSLTVASAAGFPSSGNFRILIGTEILIVTAVSGTTFTVTRGAEGTTGASHTSGDVLTHILTRDGLKQLRAEGITISADASRPAQSSDGAGRLWIPTDDVIMEIDNGSSWNNFGPVYNLTPPDDSAFSWFNQGGSTTTQNNGSVLLNIGSSSGRNWRGRVRSFGSGSDVKMAFTHYMIPKNYAICGLCVREASSGKLIVFYFGFADTWLFQIASFSDPSNFNAVYTLDTGSTAPLAPAGIGSIIWMRVLDDGTNRNFYYSHDGLIWFRMLTTLRNDYFTADQVGFAIDQENISFVGLMRLVHWSQ